MKKQILFLVIAGIILLATPTHAQCNVKRIADSVRTWIKDSIQKEYVELKEINRRDSIYLDKVVDSLISLLRDQREELLKKQIKYLKDSCMTSRDEIEFQYDLEANARYMERAMNQKKGLTYAWIEDIKRSWSYMDELNDEIRKELPGCN